MTPQSCRGIEGRASLEPAPSGGLHPTFDEPLADGSRRQAGLMEPQKNYAPRIHAGVKRMTSLGAL